MNKPLLTSTRELYSDISSCIMSLVHARLHKDGHEQEVLTRMESLMVATLQQFDCIIDYLEKEEKK